MSSFNNKINKIIKENFSEIEDAEERNNKIIKVYEFAINKISKNIKKDMDYNIVNLIKKNNLFEKENCEHIKNIWENVFNILDNILEITQETMEAYSKEFNAQARKENNLTYHAIRTIHARVVLCFKECLLLLKNGYSEGATEIWRTMYELTIVASFIKHHSNNKDLAQRYIDHIIVDNYKEENEYREQYKAPQRYTSNAFKKLKNNYNSVIKKYGKSFKNDYGWATIVLNKNKPSLRDLEVNIKNTKHHPYYKSSCYYIHSNYKGNVDKIGLINNDMLLYGPSDYGLSIPCQNIAIILNQINIEFFTIYFSIDCYISIDVINRYLDELLPLADEIQQNLQKSKNNTE